MPDLFNKIAAIAEAEAEKTMLEVEVLANIIADKMQHLDGGVGKDGRYGVLINHELGFLTIVRNY